MDASPLPLTRLETGDRAILLDLGCGRRLASRLSTLGLTPGVPLTMVQNFHHGPLIITVRGTRVALGRGEAAKMLVRRGES